MKEYCLTVPEEADGLRIDKAITQMLPELSRSAVQTICKNGGITIGDKAVDKSRQVRTGEQIVVLSPDPVAMDAVAEEIPLEIVYEDEHLLVVNKPKGMVVHPAAGNYNGTMVNALLHHCGGSLSGIGGVIRPGIVHRIDKDTSGLLIVAKNDAAHQGLAAQIKEHSFTREYAAVVHGHFKENTFTVDAPIGRSPNDRKKMCVTDRNSRNAVTHVEVLEEYPGFSYVKCRLETGRTHQIRVHMAYMGHPVAGDRVYGPKKSAIDTDGQCLHARTIGFEHPASGQWMEFTSELPPYFKALLQKIAK